jgi:hypothetical protein
MDLAFRYLNWAICLIKKFFLCWCNVLRQAFSQGPKRGRPILVQRYIYSKGRGGGGRKNVPLENLWSLRYFISVSVPSSFEIFQTHLALWVCAAMLLYLTTTFSFSQEHHQIDQNVKCIIIMRIPFPQNLGVQRRPFFI